MVSGFGVLGLGKFRGLESRVYGFGFSGRIYWNRSLGYILAYDMRQQSEGRIWGSLQDSMASDFGGV